MVHYAFTLNVTDEDVVQGNGRGENSRQVVNRLVSDVTMSALQCDYIVC